MSEKRTSNCRTKPTKEMLKAAKKARVSDYAAMVAAASEVVIRNRNASLSNQGKSEWPDYVVVAFAYFTKFAEDFPKGHIIEKEGLTDVRKINAVKLLDWLYKHGHSKYNASQLVLASKQHEVLDNSIERMFDIFKEEE